MGTSHPVSLQRAYLGTLDSSDIIYLFKQRKNIEDYLIHRADLIVKVKNILSRNLTHERTEKWRRKLLAHQDELYECLFHPQSDFNNNFAERMIRPSVIMRKITHGNLLQFHYLKLYSPKSTHFLKSFLLHKL